MIKNSTLFITFSLVFVFTYFFAVPVDAATLSLSPSGGSFVPGDTITVTISLDTQGEDTSGVDIKDLNFDPAVLSVIDENSSSAGIQISPGLLFSNTLVNSVDNANGSITFSQVSGVGNVYNGAGTLATIRFSVIAFGSGNVNFDFTPGLTSDTNVAGGGQDRLTSASGASYTISDTSAPVLSNISATSITTSGATIIWNTNEAATSQVDYGLTTSYGNQTSLDSTLNNSHSVTLSGLSPNTTYHYRVRSGDLSSNVAVSLDRTFMTGVLPDTTPPNTISDFSSSSVDETSMTLSWSAPQDVPAGQAVSYDIRHTTGILSASTWGSGIQVTGEPVPLAPGATQSYVLVGLQAGTTYQVGIKSRDGAGNVSALSNVVVQTTSAAPEPAPTVALLADGKANSVTIPYNTTTNLSWTSTNATSCDASGDWSGTKASSGNETTQILTSTATYTIVCTGTGGSSQDSVTINVSPPPAPTLSFLVNGQASNITLPSSNSGATLSWTSTFSTSCTASGDWSGIKGTSGSQSTGSLIKSSTYTLSCSGPGGTVQEGRNVNLETPSPITLDILANNSSGPVSVTPGDDVTLSWTSTNGTTCSASGGWSGSKSLNGTEVITSLQQNSTFIITCTNSSGSQSDSVTVNVVPVSVPSVTLDILANGNDGPISVTHGSSVTLSWTSANAASCDASGGGTSWKGSQSITGSAIILSLVKNTTFGLTCTNSAGSQTDSVTVNVITPPTTSSGGGGGGSSVGGGGGGNIVKDTTAPEAPSNLRIFGGPDQIALSWSNPTSVDYVRTVAVRQTGREPTSVNDGIQVYEGTDQEFTDKDIVPGVEYYYALFSFDRNLNYSNKISALSFAGAFTEQEIVEKRAILDRAVSCTIGGVQSLTLDRYITIGTKGEDVRLLQRFLNSNGFILTQSGPGSPGQETSYFGPVTASAVRKFQCAKSIVCSGDAVSTGYGTVGPKTRKALFQGEATGTCQIETPAVGISIVRHMTIGTSGEDVRILQEFLNKKGFTIAQSGPGSLGQETTYFGLLTAQAMRKFQCAKNIVCDGDAFSTGYGTVGPKTREVLKNN